MTQLNRSIEKSQKKSVFSVNRSIEEQKEPLDGGKNNSNFRLLTHRAQSELPVSVNHASEMYQVNNLANDDNSMAENSVRLSMMDKSVYDQSMISIDKQPGTDNALTHTARGILKRPTINAEAHALSARHNQDTRVISPSHNNDQVLTPVRLQKEQPAPFSGGQRQLSPFSGQRGMSPNNTKRETTQLDGFTSKLPVDVHSQQSLGTAQGPQNNIVEESPYLVQRRIQVKQNEQKMQAVRRVVSQKDPGLANSPYAVNARQRAPV